MIYQTLAKVFFICSACFPGLDVTPTNVAGRSCKKDWQQQEDMEQKQFLSHFKGCLTMSKIGSQPSPTKPNAKGVRVNVSATMQITKGLAGDG